jgi:hypothetical protein
MTKSLLTLLFFAGTGTIKPNDEKEIVTAKKQLRIILVFILLPPQ